MQIIKAPYLVNFDSPFFSIFLGGSIEMGKAEKWQDELSEQLKDLSHLLILNPRRDDWDSSWIQSKDNPQFRQQVEWELNCQEKADLLIYYFASNTMSPITLLELGLFSSSEAELIVYCSDDYPRKGNVDIVCERYGIFQVNSKKELIEEIKKRYIKNRVFRRDESLIPKGQYCYLSNGIDTSVNPPILKIIKCPYWEKRSTYIEGINAYCNFLRKGDWMNEGTSLLWDQVKECGKNMD